MLDFVRRQPIALLALFVSLGGTSYAATQVAVKQSTIHGCVAKHGQLRIAAHCKAHETAIAFNSQGPQGLPGPAGAPGAAGPAGPSDFDARYAAHFFPGSTAATFNSNASNGTDWLGEVYLTAAVNPPPGTAFAAGQLLPILQNTALFSLVGTNYGGDGKSTFALPDLRGEAPKGTNYVIALKGQFPAHP